VKFPGNSAHSFAWQCSHPRTNKKQVALIPLLMYFGSFLPFKKKIKIKVYLAPILEEVQDTHIGSTGTGF